MLTKESSNSHNLFLLTERRLRFGHDLAITVRASFDIFAKVINRSLKDSRLLEMHSISKICCWIENTFRNNDKLKSLIYHSTGRERKVVQKKDKE